MKKILVIIFSVVLVTILLSSCKTTNDCPAYGKAEQSNLEQQV